MAEGAGTSRDRRGDRRRTSSAGAWRSRDASMLVCGVRRGRDSSAIVLYLFFRTNLGTAMQAAGDNPQMIRALGVNVETR